MKIVYVTVIALCTAYNAAAQSLAFAAINLSLQYNIPVSVLINANNDTLEALTMLSLAELGEVKIS